MRVRLQDNIIDNCRVVKSLQRNFCVAAAQVLDDVVFYQPMHDCSASAVSHCDPTGCQATTPMITKVMEKLIN